MSVYTRAEDVSAEIEARAQLVTIANGFLTDVGGKVYMGKVKIDDEMAPCTSVIEGNDDVQSGPSQRVVIGHIRQQYALVGYAMCDSDRPNDAAHKIIRDYKRAIFRTDGKADPTWGGKVKAVRYRGRNIGPRADGVAMVMALVEIEVEYAEDLAA